MDQERRKVIIKEIEHWQRNKLLPDQYCNFLLNLYLVESDKREPANWNGKAAAALMHASGKLWFGVMAVAAILVAIFIYFNDLHPIAQVGIVLFGTAVGLWLGQRLRRKHEAMGLSVIGMGMLIMLGGGLYLLKLHELGEQNGEIAYLACCALFWIVCGITLRIPLLHLCGWIAGVMVYALMLYRNSTAPMWYDVQLYWLPASFIYAWGSWFVKRWSKSVSAILFIVAALIWFMPEIYSIVLLDDMLWVEAQLVIKMVLGGTLLFLLRKKWIAWVA
ncbi:hypothetical protein [Paenibacillus sp. SYP-B4298]|uniref:hypothetical protein n=1 Tax=Paenibacillus sp. SYP-B4298 TaxID=2996034 RepID=UPI0022DE36AC|nr:hypothetical protein [Paenibacillus sp. SYP-B4298]